ncbi:MAG: lysylphosphatidylglycerol synthase domain-containing protein [Solirubrobacterales bacterium]
MSRQAPTPPDPAVAPPEIDSDPTLRVVEEGLPAAAPDHSWWRRHSKGVSAAFAILVFAALVVGLYSKRDAFIDSIGAASVGVLIGATLMQVIWLIARSEAWYVCVDAAGGDCGRRPLYRAAAVGYLGNLLNPSFGLAVRIAELRRTVPDTSPTAGVLVAAEMPIVVVEIALAGLCSFTLVGPLGIPWWVPLIALVVGVGVVAGLSRVANRKRHGLWRGIAVLRGLRHRNTIIALTVLAVSAQVFRNWLVLRGIGVDVSVWDSMALLIAAAALGLLPVGPSLGVVTTVLILGSKGVAQTAAAGALLTATGAVGALLFASWALLDRLRTRRQSSRRAVDSRLRS